MCGWNDVQHVVRFLMTHLMQRASGLHPTVLRWSSGMSNALRVHAVLESSGIGSVSLQVIHWARGGVEACCTQF